MAIYAPGKRTNKRVLNAPKRNVVAILSLTAMVDLFTVLVVFLLQNYATTGAVIHIPEGVKLPGAQEVKDLEPSNVVVISKEDVRLNDSIVMKLSDVKGQTDWLLPELQKKLTEIVKQGEDAKKSLPNQIKTAVEKIQSGDGLAAGQDNFRRVTIQADETVDFLTLKKVMFTISESGMSEMNFAVMKLSKDELTQ